MTELFEAVASWKSLLLAIGAFGFAPGFILRLLVKIYPHEDPRRQELIAELYTMRRIERPLFVAEQLETVLFEGLPHRAKALWSSTRKGAVRARAWLSAGGYWEVAAWFAAAAGIADFLVNKSVELMLVGVGALVGGYVLKVAQRRWHTTGRQRYISKLRHSFGVSKEVGYMYVTQAEALYGATEALVANKRFVVYGPPAAGKTTLLRMLATSLVVDPNEKARFIPVHVSLHHWQPTKLSFREMLVIEMTKATGLRAALARKLVDSHDLVPLLDGLDGTCPTQRQSQLEAIERDWHGRPFVLTSRPPKQPIDWDNATTYSIEPFWRPVTEPSDDSNDGA